MPFAKIRNTFGELEKDWVLGLEVTGRYRYPPPDPRWLARGIETVIEPELAIVDAHHHLWVEGGHPYLLDELGDDLASGHRIIATVFVQAGFGYREDGPAHLRSVGETESVEALRQVAAMRAIPVAAGIVGFVDLTLGDKVDEQLDAHAAASPVFRGVRHSVAVDSAFPEGIVFRPAPPHLLADPDYRDGLRRVAKRGLSYDAMLYHRQIPELTALARALPELRIVLDHFGCPLGVGPYADNRAELFAQWRTDIAELAQCDNVFAKLGGLGMIVCGATWHERPDPPGSVELAAAWQPWIDECIAAFGPARCMFESNFPVDKAMVSYRTLWNAFKRASAGLSDTEREHLFRGTATSFYRLER